MELFKYYVGTLKECIEYDNKVCSGERKRNAAFFNGDNWADPVKHPTQELYAILKHENYESSMTLVDELPDNWIKNII